VHAVSGLSILAIELSTLVAMITERLSLLAMKSKNWRVTIHWDRWELSHCVRMGDRFVVNATEKFTVLDVTGTSQAVASSSSSSKNTTPAAAAGSAPQAADATAAAPAAKKSSSKSKKAAQPISLDVSAIFRNKIMLYEACSCPLIDHFCWY
jgi:hypothetical protein